MIIYRINYEPQMAAMQPAKLLSLIVFCLLAACSGSGDDDLAEFIKNAGNDLHVQIPPVPEVKAYVPFEYNVDGALFDPFKARKAASKNGAVGPDLNRPKDPLEAFPLESLQYVGMLENKKTKYALIKTPENTTQQIKLGGFMGQNFGVVTSITEGEIKLKEIVQDDASGDWVERTSSLSLQE